MDYRKRGSSWYGRLCKRSECVCCGTRYPGPVASGCCSTVCEKELDRLEASERIARRVLFTLWLSGVVMVLVAGVLLVWDSYELPLSRLTSVLGE